MAGEARPSPAYYVAFVLLVIGLLAGASLFLLLATRPHSSSASVVVGSAESTPCTVGGHGTVCYRFMVTDRGSGPAFATCQVNPASGTEATFDDGQTVKPISLLEGQTRELTVSVVPGESDTLAEPALSCSTSSA